MPTIERLSDVPYAYRIGVAPIWPTSPTSRNSCRAISSADDGFGITEKCRRYLAPLIPGEDYPAYRDGLPVYVTLKNVAVPRSCRPSRSRNERSGASRSIPLPAVR